MWADQNSMADSSNVPRNTDIDLVVEESVVNLLG